MACENRDYIMYFRLYFFKVFVYNIVKVNYCSIFLVLKRVKEKNLKNLIIEVNSF